MEFAQKDVGFGLGRKKEPILTIPTTQSALRIKRIRRDLLFFRFGVFFRTYSSVIQTGSVVKGIRNYSSDQPN